MGTPEIASVYLKSLIDNKQNIIAVYTQPPRKKGRGMHIQESPVQKLAIKNKINFFSPLDLDSKKNKQKLIALKPDLIIVMGYGLKLPSEILVLPPLGCINLHVSLLPRWRGASPIEHALLNGDKETGITIIKLIEKMDAGPILKKKAILISKHINKKDLTKKLNCLGVDLLNSLLPKIYRKTITFVNQDNAKVTYAHKISSNMRKLDFNKEIETVYNKIRAFAPEPSAWFSFNNERIKIIKSSFVKGKFQSSIILNEQFHIGCVNGKICPKIIQREGRKPMKLVDFIRGYKFIVGSKIDA
jgi:methionyl-tRNA formyltransferase